MENLGSKGSSCFICGICEAVNHVSVKWGQYYDYLERQGIATSPCEIVRRGQDDLM